MISLARKRLNWFVGLAMRREFYGSDFVTNVDTLASIRVEFSIADLNASSADELDDSGLFGDQAEEDDIAAGQSGGAQSKAAQSEGQVPTANDTAEEEEDFDDDQPISFPSRVNVTIEKVGYGFYIVGGELGADQKNRPTEVLFNSKPLLRTV